MTQHLHIRSDELLADIRSAAWLESELHPELDLHRRHEMADICEKGNEERVWRVLGVGVAEVRLALSPILKDPRHILDENLLRNPDEWHLHFASPLSNTSASFIREKTHEYLLARVMADRSEVIIPQAATVWKERMQLAIAALSDASLADAVFPRRPLSPF